MTTNTLHTGGTVGADTVWAHRAYVKGDHVKIFSFDGHKRTRLIDDEGHHEVVYFDKNEQQLCNMALEQASTKLNKKLPSTGYERHLLEKDYNLVKDVDSLYAVGHFESVEKETRLRIDGHTAWAVELFLDILLSQNPKIHHEDTMLPIFFYSQDTCKWYQLHHTLKDNFRWITVEKPSKPRGLYAGIGSREIDNLGKHAIINL